MSKLYYATRGATGSSDLRKILIPYAAMNCDSLDTTQMISDFWIVPTNANGMAPCVYQAKINAF